MTRDAALRLRLLALRADAMQQLAQAGHLDGGLLRLVADAGAALAALDVAVDGEAPTAERAIVVDDNEALRLVFYCGADALAVVPLDPAGAVRLSGELAQAAARYRARATP